MEKRKLAVIIKHPHRDYDYRVDIIETDKSAEEVKAHVEREMLGPFEVLAVTERIADRELK